MAEDRFRRLEKQPGDAGRPVTEAAQEDSSAVREIRALRNKLEEAEERAQQSHDKWKSLFIRNKELQTELERALVEVKRREAEVGEARAQAEELKREQHKQEEQWKKDIQRLEGLQDELETRERELEDERREHLKALRAEKTRRMQLETQLGERLREQQRLQEQQTQLQRNNLTTVAQIASQKSKKEATEMENVELRQRLEELQEELAALRRAREDGLRPQVPVEVEEVDDEWQRLRAQAGSEPEGGRQEGEEWEAEKEVLTREVAALTEAAREKDRERARVEEELGLLRGELQEARSTLEQVQKSSHALEEELSRRVDGSNTGARTNDQMVAELQAELGRLREENSNWETSYTESERMVSSLTNQISKYRAEAEAVKAEAVAEIKRELEGVQAELESVKGERQRLQDSLAVAEAAAADGAEAKRELAVAQEARRLARGEQDVAAVRLEKLQDALGRREQQLQEADAERSRLAAELMTLRTEFEETTPLKTMCSLLQTKVQETEAKCEKLQRSLALAELDLKKAEVRAESQWKDLEDRTSAAQEAPNVRVDLMEAQKEIRHLRLQKEQLEAVHAEETKHLVGKLRELERTMDALQQKQRGHIEVAVVDGPTAEDLAAARGEAEEQRRVVGVLQRELESWKQQAAQESLRAREGQQERQQLAAEWQRQVAELQRQVAELQRQVELGRHAALQAERAAEERVAAVQPEVDFLRTQARTSLQEVQALEGTMEQVEAWDRLRPEHRLRLYQHHTRFICSVCHAPGSGWAWRCTTPRCGDSTHLPCLTGRGTLR